MSKGTHLFGSESVQGIIEVGSIAQECVKKNHPSDFHDESRNNFVSETMCNLMGVPLRKWNWEYIDVIVSLGAKVIRYCDYVSLFMCLHYCTHLNKIRTLIIVLDIITLQFILFMTHTVKECIKYR